MKKSFTFLVLTLVALSVLLTGCCGGGETKEAVVVVPAESGPTAGQELQDLKAAHDQGAITDAE
jgi:PBP1b-binding outer membrane lipoprotein LpoB